MKTAAAMRLICMRHLMAVLVLASCGPEDSTPALDVGTARSALWSAPQQLQAGTNNATLADLDMNETGDGFAVWIQQNLSGAYDVHGRRYSVSGGWGSDVVIDVTSANTSTPWVVVDAVGDATVSWIQDSGTAWDVWARRHQKGYGWQPPVKIASDGRGVRSAVSDDRSVFVLFERYSVTAQELWAVRYHDGWEAPVMLSGGETLEVSISIDASGRAIAVWTELSSTTGLYDLFGARFLPASGWGTAVLLEGSSAGSAGSPDVDLTSAGDAMVVWRQSDGTSYNLWSKRFIAGSGWMGNALLEADPGDVEVQSPRVTIDDAGDALIVWEQSAMVRARRSVPGTGWKPIATLGSGSTLPRVDGNKAGDALAVWVDTTAGWTVRASRFEPGTGWLTPETVMISPTLELTASVVGVDGLADGLAVWGQVDGHTTWRVWGGAFSP